MHLNWREFEHNEISHSGAHYLMAVSSFIKNGFQPKAADVARQLGVSRTAASGQLRALVDQGLLAVGASKRIDFTQDGADLVARIAGKREVVTMFLRDILGVSANAAELDGCKIEHLISEETGAALVRLTRFLQSDAPPAREFVKAFRKRRARP